MTSLQTRIPELVAELDPRAFVVDLALPKVGGGGRKAVVVSVDTDGGIRLAELSALNRNLRERLEAEGLLPEEFALEVASPGVGSPLKVHRQFTQNIGRRVELVLRSGAKLSGVLEQANEGGLILSYDRKNPETRKKETLTQELFFTDIKETRVLVSFKENS